MSIWTKISEECFQHLVESMPRRIKAALKSKIVQPGTSKLYLIKWPVTVCHQGYATMQKFGVSKIYFFKKLIILLNNDALN